MQDLNTLDPGSEAVLRGLQPLFDPYGTVTPVQLNAPGLVSEFRPDNIKDTDLGDVPKPALDWAFGVELGGINGDARLCAVAFRKWSHLAAFYNANPALHGTLITCWHSAATIWLRATGRLPVNFNAESVQWCANGVIPVGCPKQLSDAYISQHGEIALLDFSQLLWNERQQAEIERVFLEMEVGPPFRTVARGRRVLNVAFWARYFAGMLPITYDPRRSLFSWGNDKSGQVILLNSDDTTKEFTNLLQAAAPSFGAAFPQGEIRTARVRQLVERIKALTQQTLASDGEVLDAFLEHVIDRTPGKDISSYEFRAGYVDYCKALGRVPCAALRFYKLLRAKLKGLGIDQRHDIIRHGKRVRGYSGLALKSPEQVKTTDRSDTADAADVA